MTTVTPLHGGRYLVTMVTDDGQWTQTTQMVTRAAPTQADIDALATRHTNADRTPSAQAMAEMVRRVRV